MPARNRRPDKRSTIRHYPAAGLIAGWRLAPYPAYAQMPIRYRRPDKRSAIRNFPPHPHANPEP
ncbi:hypothetical protein EH164_17080 [Kosakonia sp. CCTCC M2018092]|nr:hypothetical protein EH164_17080 [Kosakonia sp. CCTCC M2018092]